MKKFILTLIALVLLATNVNAKIYIYSRKTLDGASNSVSNIPYATLHAYTDPAVCVVYTATKVYRYMWIDASTTSQTLPEVIEPNDISTNDGRWELITWTIGPVYSETFTIREPDLAQEEADDLRLKHFVTEAYPAGAILLSIHVGTSASVTDTFLFEEWSNVGGTSQVTVESIALSATTTGEDNGIDNAGMAADSYLVLNFDDAQDDISEVVITISYMLETTD